MVSLSNAVNSIFRLLPINAEYFVKKLGQMVCSKQSKQILNVLKMPKVSKSMLNWLIAALIDTNPLLSLIYIEEF